MVVFNTLAAGMAFIGMLVGYGLQSVVGRIGETNFLAASFAMIVMMLLDSTYRVMNNQEGGAGRLIWPSQGGHVMLIPVWFGASLMLVFGVIDHLAAGG